MIHIGLFEDTKRALAFQGFFSYDLSIFQEIAHFPMLFFAGSCLKTVVSLQNYVFHSR